MPKRILREFAIDVEAPPDQVWELVSDTARMNALAGNPKYEAYEVTNPDQSVDVFARLSVAGFTVEWQELPVNWIANQWFEQIREFRSGPLERLRAMVRLTPLDTGTRCDYLLECDARNWLGRVGARRSFRAYEAQARETLSQITATTDEKPVARETIPETSVIARRAHQIAEQIETTPYGHGLAHQLADFVLNADELDVWTIRPLNLATLWSVEPRKAIEVCLQSVRLGLLESRWDLLCPRCRVAKAQPLKLDSLPDNVHCPSCNIDFEADFAQNVELAFTPAPAIRSVEFGFYCRSGPGMTPHVKGQITVAPQETRIVKHSLPASVYRFRTLEVGAEVLATWAKPPFPALTVLADDSLAVHDGQPEHGDDWALANHSERTRTVIVEDQGWREDALTAARVTTLQAFRDLFSDQLLRPGDDVAINNVTFMFTDLAGSTALFERIGDAPAYRVVRDHFDVIGAMIREHDGSVVKTLGDGVHAAFSRPDDAVHCAMAIQGAFSPNGETPLPIRIGIHSGSSISVTLNDRLDYYGTTVNLAARLESLSDANETTLSEKIFSDPAVQETLSNASVRAREVSVRGVDAELTVHQFSVTDD